MQRPCTVLPAHRKRQAAVVRSAFTFDMDFTLSRLERVLSGPGQTMALGAELDRLSRRRAVVVTGTTLGASPLLARVTDALGSRCVRVFTGARQHVPETVV